jgi:hypothetical protein
VRGVAEGDLAVKSRGKLGITLAEALKKSSDPTEWKDYQAIERACLSKKVILEPLANFPTLSTIPDPEHDRLLKAWEEARARLVDGLISRLRDGIWWATGFAAPMTLESKAVQIPDEQWRVLVPDFVASAASCRGVEYLGVEVHTGDPPSELPLREQRIIPTPSLGRPMVVAAGNKKRTSEPSDVAMRLNRYQSVHAAARSLYGHQAELPSFDLMANELAKPEHKLGFKKETIRQILNGTYPPARQIGRFILRRAKR